MSGGRYAAPSVAERLLPELARAYEVIVAVQRLAADPALTAEEARRRIRDLLTDSEGGL
jgi:hypothetical protein